MTTVHAPMPSNAHVEVPVSTRSRSPVPPLLLVGAVAWLLFGSHAFMQLGKGSLSPSLAPLAPLAIAWALDRYGPRVLVPIAVAGLMPSIGFNLGPGAFGVRALPLPMVMLGLGAGAWYAARRAPERWMALLHRRHVVVVPLAAWLVIAGRFDWPARSVPDLSGLRFDISGLAAGLLLVSAIRWRALAATMSNGLAKPGPATSALVRAALPAALVAAAALRYGVNVGPFYASWGSAWAIALAPALSLLIVLGAVGQPRRRLLILTGLLAATLMLEAWRLYAGLPAMWQIPPRMGYPGFLPELGELAVDSSAAMLLGVVVSGRWKLAEIRWSWLLGLTVLVLGLRPLIQGSSFYPLGPSGWVVGAIAYLAAVRAGAMGLMTVPPALACAVLVAPRFGGGNADPTFVLTEAVAVAAVAGLYGFFGLLKHREQRTTVVPTTSERWRVDVGALANFVRRLDTSATLQSFGTLLVVLGVVAALAQMGVFSIVVGAWNDFDAFEPEELAIAALVVIVGALLPLSFLVFDAIHRSDRWRPQTALSGAALAAIGIAAAASIPAGVALLFTQLDGSRYSAPVAAVALAALFVGLLTARKTWLRSSIAALLSLLVLAAVAAAAYFMWQEAREEALSAVLALVAAGFGAALLWRAVALRADLAADVPRGLLYGEIGGAGFWGRLACLLGMPASTWNRRALATPAFWALAVARPLVYAGGIGLLQGRVLLGVVLLIAGHGLFEGGKRLAARRIWRVGRNDGAAPVLFLRSFEDDQFDLGSRSRNPVRRWLELWSFRRNLDEMLVDEIARYGTIVALGKPGETRVPFGAVRHYSTHDDWQRVITETARRARAVVVVAGATPGVRWEYELLAREGLLDRTVLLFRPGIAQQAVNRAALEAFPLDAAQRAQLLDAASGALVALLHVGGAPVLLTAPEAHPGAYVLALRAHFQKREPRDLACAALAAPLRSMLPW